MKKKILFCEGKNDVLFISELLSNTNINYKIFPEKLIKNKTEQGVIISFKEFYSTNYDIIIKEEGGKEKLFESFNKILNNFLKNTIRENYICVVIFDSDNVSFLSYKKKKQLFKNYIIKHKESYENTVNIYAMNMNIDRNKDKDIENIYFIEFCPSLEKIIENLTGIDIHNISSEEERKDYIKKLITESNWIKNIMKILEI